VVWWDCVYGLGHVSLLEVLLDMKELIYLKDVVTLELNQEVCVGCKMCLVVCPHDVFGMGNGHAVVKNRDACMECGACATNCPTEAVTVNAGVGCATAVINTALNRDSSSCCCVVESQESTAEEHRVSPGADRTTCC
jgi:NAD-dependent dihydropyrimidine dehydrogenase PreA subunit